MFEGIFVGLLGRGRDVFVGVKCMVSNVDPSTVLTLLNVDITSNIVGITFDSE